jgi:hypothetical protein
VLAVVLAGITVAGLLFSAGGAGLGAVAGTQNVLSGGGDAATQATPPAADAGENRTATERTSLSLSAEGSSAEANSETLSYSWTQTGGPSVTLSDADTPTPTFTAPGVESATALTFEVNVTGSEGATDTDRVTVIVQPLVDESTEITSQDRIVMGDDSVQLSVSDAVAPEENDLSYSWTQTAGPAVNLTDANTAEPSFTTPEFDNATTLTFEVDVANGAATDTVNITVYPDNEPPTAEVVGRQIVGEDGSTTLDGGASTDPDSDSLNYEWNQTAGPEAETGSTSEPALTVTALNIGEYTNITFELTVTDEHGAVDTETVNVTVVPTSSGSSSAGSANNSTTANSTSTDTSDDDDGTSNSAPEAITGDERTVTAGTTVSLSGSESYDPDGDSLTTSWTQTDGPDVTLEYNSPASFTAPEVEEETTMTFQLTVSDGEGGTDISTVDITVEPSQESDGPTYYQVDFVEGEPLSSLGPEDSDNFYNDEERLVQYLWGSSEEDVTGQGYATTLNESTDACIESEEMTVSDGMASVTFTIADGCTTEVSLVSYTMPNAEFDRSTASQQELHDSTTVTLSAGTHTITVDLPA